MTKLSTYSSSKIVFAGKAGEPPRTIEVRLVKAGSEPYSLFRETCGICKGDVGRQKICKNGCKKFDPAFDIVKAISIGEGEKEIFAQEEIDGLKEVQKNLSVRTTIKLGELTRSRSMESYYVLPSTTKVGKKKIIDSEQLDYYSVLFAGLVESKEAIIVTEAIRGKEHMGALIPEAGRMIYVRMYFDEYYRPLEEDGDFTLTKLTKAQTVRAADFIKKIKKIHLKEIEFDFNKKVEELIAQGKGKTVTSPAEKPLVTVQTTSKKKIDSFLS